MNNERASYYRRISGDLLDVINSLGSRLTAQQQTWAHDFLDANELALALEMIADWLSEDSLAISKAERNAMRVLADEMAMGDRVASVLDFCPVKPDDEGQQ